MSPILEASPSPLARSRPQACHLRLPAGLAALALAILLWTSNRAEAADLAVQASAPGIAMATGLEPAAQQREGRRGGGEFRGQRGGGVGTARIDTPREFRQERRADRQDFRQERRGDRQDLRREQRGDLRDFRQERRADRQDFRNGVVTRPEFRADRRDDRQDFRRDQRGDLRDFRRDRRDDRRDFRADRRNQNRAFFNVGRYYPPVRGWNYRRLGIGFTLGAPFFASSFWINDPWAYRLPPAYGQYRWVRYYGDVLLVDIYTGQVVDVINDFFW